MTDQQKNKSKNWNELILIIKLEKKDELKEGCIDEWKGNCFQTYVSLLFEDFITLKWWTIEVAYCDHWPGQPDNNSCLLNT